MTLEGRNHGFGAQKKRGRYQKSNNGNFPSLNLTHKEVGGSFYTVREIVREVIQENRVLGPAKLTAEEQSPARLLEQYQLASSSSEPKTDMLPPDEFNLVTRILPSHHQDASGELVLNPGAQSPESECQRFDGENLNESIRTVEKGESFDKSMCTESQSGENLELEVSIAELETSKTDMQHLASNVVTEKKPLVSSSMITNGLDEKPSEPCEMTGTFDQKEIGKLDLEDGSKNVTDSMNSLESSSVLGSERAHANHADPLSPEGLNLVNEETVGNVEDALVENFTDSTITEGSIPGTSDGRVSEVPDTAPAEIKPADALGSVPEQNLESISASGSYGPSISTKAVVSKNNPNVQNGRSSSRGSNPTMDGKNVVELSGTSSAKSTRPGTNLLLAFVTSLFAALAKFWSE